MITAIIHKEFISTLRDGRLLMLGLSVFLLLLGFLLASTQELQALRAEKQFIGTTAKEQWNTQSVKNPHAAAHYGIYVFKPDSPVAALDSGLRPFTGQSLWLEPHKRNLSRFAPSGDAVLAHRFGQASASFVLYALLPLLILALSFNAVSQERERGTLRMLHSLGIEGKPLLFGKLLGLLAAFSVVLSPALLLALLILQHGFSLSADDVARLALLLLSLLIYYTVFAALAIAASAYLHSSRLTLFCLLAFWLASVFIAPRLGAVSAELFAPLPTAEQFWFGIKHDIANNAAQREQAFEAEVLAKYNVTRKEDLPVGFVSLNRQHNDEYSSRVHQQHFDTLRDTFKIQQHLTHLASWLGPSIAMRSLSMSLAGMDLAHQRDFENTAEDYRRYFINLTEDWDRERSHGTERTAKGSEHDWRSVKDFSYTAPSVGFALKAAYWDVLVLGLWLSLALFLVNLSAKKLTP